MDSAYKLAKMIEPYLLGIITYRDCLSFWKEEYWHCGKCPIIGSGLPYPHDICDLSLEEKEEKIGECLDKICKLCQRAEQFKLLIEEE